MPRRSACGSTRRRTAYSATNIATIKGSVTKLTNTDHTASGAATYRPAMATMSAKNSVHASVTRRV